jgi:hypothetical protein
MTQPDSKLPRCIAITPSERAFIAVETLKSAVAELESLHETAPRAVSAGQVKEIEDAELRIALLLPRLRMTRSIVHLCNQFGKAP